MKTALMYVLCAVWCCCSGYTISQCGSGGTLNVTETQHITLTCTGIRDTVMFWDLQPSSNHSLQLIALCTWPSPPCRVNNISVYEVSRTQYDTSTLTVTHTTRDSIAGKVRCIGKDNPKTAASCIVRVVHALTTATTTQTTTKTTTARETPSITAQQTVSTTNDDDDDGLSIPVIAGGAGGGLFVIIAVVIAIVVWKKRCDPTYARPTRRSQVIDTTIYTELDPQQQDSIEQAPEEDVYEDTTGQQPTGHGTVEYVNTATGTQAAEGTVYMNV
ncbi:uncharacterized protein [Littorina saxatilis]|uniref:uncharacterized protein n=1 Tax=Littorina saxatilis TaxID=31220 RepID=UPI0038B6A860